MEGVLNEATDTVHRADPEGDALETACGLARDVDAEWLRTVRVERAVDADEARKCGRCFEEAGGY